MSNLPGRIRALEKTRMDSGVCSLILGTGQINIHVQFESRQKITYLSKASGKLVAPIMITPSFGLNLK